MDTVTTTHGHPAFVERCWKCGGNGRYPSSYYRGLCIPCDGSGVLIVGATKTARILRSIERHAGAPKRRAAGAARHGG